MGQEEKNVEGSVTEERFGFGGQSRGMSGAVSFAGIFRMSRAKAEHDER